MLDDLPLSYVEAAYLRDGRFACVVAILAVLHERGLVAAGQHQTVRRGEATGSPVEESERVVWSALHGSISVSGLTSLPTVDQWLTQLRRRLGGRRLIRFGVPVRSFTPARTGSGKAALAACRERYPWPLTEDLYPDPEARVGLPVALYGPHALRLLMPVFAADGGLLTRRAQGDSVNPTSGGTNAVGGYGG